MITITGTKFGTIEVDETSTVTFANGLIGFPDCRTFVLLERGPNKVVGHLQAVEEPGLSFPVMDGALIDPGSYPEPSLEDLARGAGLAGSELALLVVVAVRPDSKTLEANLLAPLVVDVETRRGAQVVLDPRRYDANAPVMMTTSATEAEAKPAPEAPMPIAVEAIAEAQAKIAALRARSAG
ncbi:MAG: flagellar assembly protein FliW [Myxococcota bacterium]